LAREIHFSMVQLQPLERIIGNSGRLLKKLARDKICFDVCVTFFRTSFVGNNCPSDEFLAILRRCVQKSCRALCTVSLNHCPIFTKTGIH